MNSLLCKVVLEYCNTYGIPAEATEKRDYVWMYSDDVVRISALLQSFLVVRFPSICFDRHIYEEENTSIISANYNDFGVCVTSERDVF